jgi:formylglycine-generating enzyme required for sulfatase activity
LYQTDARAFCQYLGGDLLTEAQWEYVAAAAGRDAESPFAWGTDPPTCDTVVYARHDDANVGGVACQAYGFGARPVTEGVGDVTPVYGLRGLGGSLGEYLVDDFHSYRTVCWAAQPLHDPRCVDASAESGVSRGGSWHSTAVPVHSRGSSIKMGRSTAEGFRCAWVVTP